MHWSVTAISNESDKRKNTVRSDHIKGRPTVIINEGCCPSLDPKDIEIDNVYLEQSQQTSINSNIQRCKHFIQLESKNSCLRTLCQNEHFEAKKCLSGSNQLNSWYGQRDVCVKNKCLYDVGADYLRQLIQWFLMYLMWMYNNIIGNQKYRIRMKRTQPTYKYLIISILVLISCVLVNVDGRPNIIRYNLDANDVPSISSNVPSGHQSHVVKRQIDIQNDNLLSEHIIDSTPIDENAVGGKEIPSYPIATFDFTRVQTPFIIGIWILSASIAKIGFHMAPKLHLMFPESCLLIVVGLIIGTILLLVPFTGNVSPLTPTTFLLYMLPPIILDAGYFMPNRLFFDNLGTILLMAVVGTVFNTGTIGLSLWAIGQTGFFSFELPMLDVFLFSSLISAVDPVAVLAVFEEIHVDEILYIVVFGESLLNDAVTVVLYHMCESYTEIGITNINLTHALSSVLNFLVVALGGTIIGIIWGFLTGLVTRFTDHVRVIEPIFVFVMAYLAYLSAEIFHMSGILAITFCGITMKNYVEQNISQKSHTTIKYALKMLSSSSETIIFMFLGVATVNNEHDWNTAFVILTIIFCSLYRCLGVIILSAIANKFRLHKLSKVDQFVLSYGGLRGAVAFALVLLISSDIKMKKMFVTTTIAVIYFTVFLQGITIKPLVRLLNVKRAEKRKPTMNERIHERFMDHLMAGIEDIVGKTGNYNVRDKFKRFDNKFIRPLLIRNLQGAEPKILETYSKLTMKDAVDFMRRNPSTIGQMSGTESMSGLFRNYTSSGLAASPSFSNFENSSRNLDMHELDYNPSKKDLTDARIHHLLAEELKPYKRHRRLSYSRHAVDDRDLSTQVNYKMHMNIRRMANDRKHHKRSKRGNKDDGRPQNHVSFPELKLNASNENGTKKFHQNRTFKRYSNSVNKYHRLELDSTNEQLHDVQESEEKQQQADDWDDCLTFTAKSTPDSDLANNNSLIAHITNLPGFDTSKARIVKHYTTKSSPSDSDRSPIKSAAELILPWRRDRSYLSFVEEKPSEEEREKRFSKDSEGEVRVMTPTAIETQLPWKRTDENTDDAALKQNEFPAWASNKEYLAYNSPSATFLGGLSKPRPVKSVIGLFRRESAGSALGTTPTSDSDQDQGSAGESPKQIGHAPPLKKRSASIAVPQNNRVRDLTDGHDTHSGPFPVTASHRRHNRRGSLLEISGDTIPEENSSNSCYEKDDDWNDDDKQPDRILSTSKNNTPRRENRNPDTNPQARALLGDNKHDDDDDDEDDVEKGSRSGDSDECESPDDYAEVPFHSKWSMD